MTPHVLAVRLDSDGDVLVTGPAIRAVAAGATRVTLLCGPRGRQAAALLPGVDRHVVHRAAWIDPEPEPLDPEATLALVEELTSLGADEAIVFTSFHQSALPTALLLRLAGIPRVGAISDDYPGSLLDVRHRVDDEIHEVERALSLAEAMGYPLPPGDDGRLAVRRSGAVRVAPRGPTPSAPPSRREPTNQAEGSPGSDPIRAGYVVVHPGASVPARAWPAELHAELVQQLVAVGRRVVVTGSPEERELSATVAGAPRRAVLDLGGRTTFAQLADVLARADAVVVGNTGPAHLAAAVGTPVVSLFAPVVPAVRWRPWGVPHVLLGDQDAACAGSRARECPVAGHPCLSSVSPADVLAAIDELAPVREREAVAL